MVSAVPGSGKTRTLAARVIYMVTERGINPAHIVLLTFTRYAANEMRERLGALANRLGYLGTFHAFALRILYMYGREHGWQAEWLTILDEDEADLELRDVLKDLNIIDRYGKWKGITKKEWDAFRNAYGSGSLPTDEKDITPKMARMNTAMSYLMARLRAENVLTFSGMILEARALLENPKIKRDARKQFRHILVDEAQDTDGLQWNVVELLKPESLFVVGDLDQSIFEWRNARPDLFMAYAKKAKRHDLSNSYRFGFNIALPATKLIRHNVQRIDIAIHAIGSNQGTVTTHMGYPYDSIPQLIEEEISVRNRLPQDIAVLSRTHGTLEKIGRRLDSDGRVPYTRIGGAQSGPVGTAAFRAIKSYMRLAVNRLDRRAFMGIATVEDVSTDDLWKLREESLKSGKSLLDLHNDDPDFPPKDLDELQAYIAARDPITAFEPAFDYLQNLARYEGLDTLADIVQYLAMESMQDRLRSVGNTVTLCTIHAAKGLEWPTVLLVGLNAKKFPSPRAIGEGRVEEERRLCYVAMTRAEQQLYLINHPEDNYDGGVSQFLEEMKGDEAHAECTDDSE